jgi:hypothetical protein
MRFNRRTRCLESTTFDCTRSIPLRPCESIGIASAGGRFVRLNVIARYLSCGQRSTSVWIDAKVGRGSGSLEVDTFNDVMFGQEDASKEKSSSARPWQFSPWIHRRRLMSSMPFRPSRGSHDAHLGCLKAGQKFDGPDRGCIGCGGENTLSPLIRHELGIGFDG